MSESVPKPGDDPPGGDNVKEYVAELFAAGTTVKQIAELADVHERTVRRWLHEPTIRARVEGIRSTSLSTVAGLLGRHLRSSMVRLLKLTRNADDKRLQLVAIRLHADFALKIRLFEAYDVRLRVLEEQAGIVSPPPEEATA
jgi:transposase